ncbi:hypothetical protein Trydic_g11119 [Trypoxylus dichotomus]
MWTIKEAEEGYVNIMVYFLYNVLQAASWFQSWLYEHRRSNNALFLNCNETIAVLKEYNFKRHHETFSKLLKIYRKFADKNFKAFKRELKPQQSLSTKVNNEQKAATRARFRVVVEIAKRGKPDREMMKECVIAIAEEMDPKKIDLFKTVSLSANTMTRRVQDIAENISQLSDINGYFEWFSLALDESTEVSDSAHVSIFIQGADKVVKCMKSFLILIVFTA